MGSASSDWARNLEQDADGIWFDRSARKEPASLSFPEDGHNACFPLEDESFWFAHRNECIVRALERFPFPGPLLDVGGGNGAVCVALERRGIPAVLLEPHVSGARNAKRRGVTDVVCATLQNAAFDAGSFGAAGLFDVLEHVDDPSELLGAVSRVLRPGGMLCVTVPAYQWLWSAEDEVAEHHRRYTLTRLRRSFREARFEVRYATYLFAPLTLPVFLLRSLPHRIRPRERAAVERSSARDHRPSPHSRRFLELILAQEQRAVTAGRSIPFGTSCLAVATALKAPFQ